MTRRLETAALTGLLALALTTPACGGASPSMPAEGGGDREDAGAGDDEGAPVDVSAAVERVRDAHGLVALGGAVVSGDGLLAIGASGLRRRDASETVTLDDRWHLGSNTKAMTATLAAILVEEGAIGWDTTVAQAFPGFADDIHPDLREVTLVHLLSHRAGLAGDPTVADWTELPAGSLPEQRLWLAGRLLGRAPEAAPETAYIYSNAGFIVAGAMLEQATGRPWEALLRERVLEPLGMDGCGFGAPGTAGTVDQPRGHAGEEITPFEPGPYADNPPALGPAGTVHCPLDDWAAFAALHLRGARGDTEILPRAAFERLHAGPGFSGAPDGFLYGYGWIIRDADDWSDGAVLLHNGSNTLWYAAIVLGPTSDRAYLMVTNQYTGADPAVAALFQTLLAEYPPGDAP